MNKPHKMKGKLLIAAFVIFSFLAGPMANAQTTISPTDWDLYMLRLINRARLDPTGEAGRISSSVVDKRAPVPPLAYDTTIAQGAKNHNDWMHSNFGNLPASALAPDSYSHYETINGLSSGTAAVGTPNYTGALLGTRITSVGYSWGSIGENLLRQGSINPIDINTTTLDSYHRRWWDSPDGHRNNMLSANFADFGFAIGSQSFKPPRGGLNSPTDNLTFATQNFGRRLTSPRNSILGLLYTDRDASGAWNPRENNDPLREGAGNVAYKIYSAGTSDLVTSGTTITNGSFSSLVANGTYDIVFSGLGLTKKIEVKNIEINGANKNIGDIMTRTTPTTIITSPTNGTIVRPSSRNTMTANASDDVAVTRVQFLVNGVQVCSDDKIPYACSWLTSAEINKNYSLQTKAYDASGNVGASTIVQVTAK